MLFSKYILSFLDLKYIYQNVFLDYNNKNSMDSRVLKIYHSTITESSFVEHPIVTEWFFHLFFVYVYNITGEK